jgi:hypothetical protein
MIKTIFFTKDRPLQFRAFVESFLFCSGYEETTTVVVHDGVDYKGIFKKLPRLIEYDDKLEGGFDKLFRRLVGRLEDDDLVLFGCDDQVYTRPFNMQIPEDYMISRPDVMGFSLRLGLNISHVPQNLSRDRRFFEWNWRGQPSHWGYPFELMGTVYRGSLLKTIIDAQKEPIRCPNFYESFGVQYCFANAVGDKMAMLNTPNYTVAQDVNRVQDFFNNKVQGDASHHVAALKQDYIDGKRLKWENLFKITPSDLFVGHQYWEME